MRPHCYITGASSGIGAALAKEYAKDGYNLTFTGRRVPLLNQLKQELVGLYPDCKIIVSQVDVCDEKAMSESIADSLKQFQRLDVLIANAGYVVGGEFKNLQTKDYRNQFETNVFGVLHTIYPALKSLEESNGSLSIIGSVNSYLTPPTVSAYAMSKYAVRSLGEALYHELKPKGISVTMIYPGFVKSDIRIRNKQGAVLERKKKSEPKLAMDTDVAARQIKRAIDKRKQEAVITWHGKFAVWFKRFCPVFLPYLFRLQSRGKK